MLDRTTPPAGLLHAMLLDGSGGSRALSWSEVGSWQAGDGCLWMHFSLEEPDTHEWITQASGLTEIATGGILSEETRPRTVHRDSRLLLILRGVNPRLSDEPDDLISLRIWTDGTRVISTRYRGLESTEQMVEALQGGEGPRTVQELLEGWIEGIVERMKSTVDSFEERVMEIDERVLGGDTAEVRLQLSEIRKQLVTIRRFLAPQREALNRLTSAAIPWLDEDHRLLLRETTDRLVRHIEDLDEVRDRAVLIQEELLTQVSEAMNKRAYVFTVVATIFLPLGFLTGLMGINVGGMPGIESDNAFWIVVAICVVLMVILSLLFRFNRWL